MAATGDNEALEQRLDTLDEAIETLEERLRAGEDLALEPTLEEGVDIARRLLTAYAEHAGKEMPETDDLLKLFKAFVKGDPSLNAVRDNLRELVYYQNCIAMERRDALPEAPERMVVRTIRHLYLYLRTRCEQEGRLP